eukprot:TRINITY_DN669_c0_g1_i5.p1 TRINITY_DN669_c0_g1~~TRINITY_DN669_c0_g1_i5.p1  ORF type:complete len:295 (-),score=10.52 TRINITY_DN669_c0_g1_i5:154-1038(-)
MAFTSGLRSVAVLSALLFLFVARCQEVDDQIDFDYGEGPKGPSNWGNIKEEWKTCGEGKQQSPIDIITECAVLRPNLGHLRRHYVASEAKLVNRGHDIQVKWPSGGGSIMINGTNFTLNQLHWHTPSEHTINGKSCAMELHLVHQSQDGKIAVIGILYKYGRTDSFILSLEKEIRALVDTQPESENHTTVERDIGLVNAMRVQFGSRKYYRYIGSLTTPPCSEGVTWTILHQVSTVGREQVRLLREAVHDGYENNARPVQDLNGREISNFDPRLDRWSITGETETESSPENNNI